MRLDAIKRLAQHASNPELTASERRESMALLRDELSAPAVLALVDRIEALERHNRTLTEDEDGNEIPYCENCKR